MSIPETSAVQTEYLDWDCIYARLSGDREDMVAWDALTRRVDRWARSVFWSRGPHFVEDVVAETCGSVALGIASARGPDTFAGFIYGHFLNARRRLLRTQYLSDLSASLDGIDLADDAAADEPDPEALAMLRRALESLPLRERRAVSLRYFDELPAARIAAELGVSNCNARRIVFNGVRRLRAQLEPKHTSRRRRSGNPAA